MSEKLIKPASAYLDDALKSIKNRVDGKLVGVKTHFQSLHKIIEGFEAGDFIIIAARPSMGKTAFATNLATSLASDKPVYFLSLEMSRRQVLARAVFSMAGLSFESIRVDRSKLKTLAEIRQNPVWANLYINDDAATTPEQMYEQLKEVENVGAIFVDYLQLMKPDIRDNNSREREVADISRLLKQTAKDFNAPLFALSQLNRQLTNRSDKRPTMSDLRASGALEQDADVILFIHREDAYNRDEQTGEAEIIVEKQRNGPTGLIKMYFDGPSMTFIERNE